MTFSISFPSLLRIIRQMFSEIRELYTGLLGLGIIIDVDFLKCEGQ